MTMKIKFTMHRRELEGLADLLSSYIEILVPNTIAEKWVMLEVTKLQQRLWMKGQVLAMQRKTKGALSVPMGECFAFVTLMDKHPLNPALYIDNTVLQMLNIIKQAVA